MTLQRILKYIISLVLCLLFQEAVLAQNDSVTVATDSLKIHDQYGLRIGVDIAKLIRTGIDDDYSGFELIADFRLSKKWYLATEIGTENKFTSEDFIANTTKGSYIKAGADYNAYTNLLGLENMIYFGFRAAASSFSQTLEHFTTNNKNRYFDPQFQSKTPNKFNNLKAIWAEIQFGVKAEVLKNLFIGVNLQLKMLASEDQPENYTNLYIPGFNKTYDSGSFGFGYGYTVSYFIPIFKK